MTDEELARLEAIVGPNDLHGASKSALKIRFEDGSLGRQARTAIPALIAEVRRLRAWRETVINLYPDIEEPKP